MAKYAKGQVKVYLWRQDVTDQTTSFQFFRPTTPWKDIYGWPDQGLIVGVDGRAALTLKDGTVYHYGIESHLDGQVAYRCPALALMN